MRPPQKSTLFPYTTLFRSLAATNVNVILTAAKSEWYSTNLATLDDGNLRRTIFPPPNVLGQRSEEHTSELQSRLHLVCRLLLEKKKDIGFFVSSVHRHCHV